MTQISLTRALVALKTTSDKIDTAIASGKFIAKTIGKNQFRKVVGANDSVESMTAKIQASYDTVDSLIEYRAKLKSAIVLSNANTKVLVLGKEITVAECIDLKSTVDFRKKYLNVLRLALTREMLDVDKANTALDAAIDVSMNSIYGSEKSKVSEDSYKAVSGPQKEQKEAALLDPQKIETKIEKLTKEIEELSSEIDFLLSESNARTVIEV